MHGSARHCPLSVGVTGGAEKTTPWRTRVLLPRFKKLAASGVLRPHFGGRDITELISEDRDR